MKSKNRQRKKLVALTAIAGMMMGLGVTALAAGGIFYGFQQLTDPFTTSSSLDVRNLNVILDDDTLRLTATVKNSGQTSITAVFIDSITVSDVTLKQDQGGVLNAKKTGTGTYFCTVAFATAPTDGVKCSKITDARGFSLSSTAINADDKTYTVTSSTLEGGRTSALVMEIESTSAPDLSADVNISDKLNLVLRFTSGQDELLTDVFTTRVKPG